MGETDRRPRLIRQVGSDGRPKLIGGPDPVPRTVDRMQSVARWERWIDPHDGKPGYWAHNHLENGHTKKGRPTPFRDPSGREYSSQRDSWKKATWRKSFGYLDADLVFNEDVGQHRPEPEVQLSPAAKNEA
jgi:hypothetical protein